MNVTELQGHYSKKKKHFVLLGAKLTHITNILYIITNIYIQCTKSKATQFIYRLKLGENTFLGVAIVTYGTNKIAGTHPVF